MTLSLTPRAHSCLVSSATTSPHRSLISLSCFVNVLQLVGVVYHQGRTSDCAVMVVKFRAGEFTAAQIYLRILTPWGQRLNSAVCLPAGLHRGHFRANQLQLHWARGKGT